ncbi:MAG: transcriptional regulator [Myxococcales bacterium]|nr:transcriptional regulator [Myxococcales bacterium]
METSNTSLVLSLAQEQGLVRTRDVRARGIPHTTLGRLVERGDLIRVARGLYMHPDADVTEHHSLAQASARFPDGVICLLSALVFHGLSDEAPFEVWMAYERGRTRPQVNELPIRRVAFSSKHFHFGVQIHRIEGVDVPITTAAKTVADCFKFRGRVGLEPCLAALKDYRRQQAGTLGELLKAAEVCRVANVIKPYLEVVW